MSDEVEYADDMVNRMIRNLIDEFESTGFLSTPSSERKAQIIEEIAKLRASMNPTIVNNYGPQS
jgi:hypothetical protein